ncbi:MAG: glycosyltransferase family 4 protein [Bacteroidota bacterium]
MSKNIALFIMPRSSKAWKGSEALWITVAGWARAAERKFGNAAVVTTDDMVTASEAMDFPRGLSSHHKAKSRFIKFLPEVFKTFLKDLRQYRYSRNKSHYQKFRSEFKEHPIFIWEHHDIFPGLGRKIADQFGVPLITYVHAPQVWEASKWGVKRPIWGQWIEKRFEAESLRRTDLVACVSEEVAQKLKAMGIQEKKILVSPMAVDQDRFLSIERDDSLISAMNLKDKFVVGWTGSFRRFHGVDILVRAFKRLFDINQKVALLLVGDGHGKQEIKELVRSLGISETVVFAGRKNFSEIPKYVALFDAAVVSANSKEGFHYSPLKLREYMCGGVPSLAPDAGEIPYVFKHKENIFMYKTGDVDDLFFKLNEVLHDAKLRNSVGENGQGFILNNGTWDHELNRALRKVM